MDTAFSGRSEAVRTRLRTALREAFERCVDTAIDEHADAVLVAGDLIDGGRLSFETERFLLAQVTRLNEAGIAFVYATGNHDPADSGRRWSALRWPPNVSLIDSAVPKTVAVRGGDGRVVGLVTGAGHATSNETEDLSLRLRPDPDSPLPQVAILHTHTSSSGTAGRHKPYAPSQLGHLRRAGFHYWVLGHVHAREQLSAEPPVWYPGNLQGRNPAETGPKGGLLVDLGDPGRPVVEFREFAPVRWEKVVVTGLRGAETAGQLVREIGREVERYRGLANDAAPGDAAAPGTPEPVDEADGDEGTDPSDATDAAEGTDGPQRMLVVELEGPSPLWRELRDRSDIEALEDEIARHLGVWGAEVRSDRVYPPVDLAGYAERPDVLGTVLRLADQVVTAPAPRALAALELGEEDLAGYDPKRDGTLDDYLRSVMEGAAEEIVHRMIDPRGSET